MFSSLYLLEFVLNINVELSRDQKVIICSLE